MLDILLFEMIFLVSGLLNLWQILFQTERLWEIHLVFAVGLGVALLAGYLGRKNKRWLWLVAILAALMPIISQPALRWSVPILGFVLWRYLAAVPAPHNELDYADKLLVITFSLIGMVILRDNTSFFVGQTAPIPVYLPLMIVSGIFFLRSLRHHRTGQSHWRIRRSNLIYLAFIGLTYLVSQSLWLRHQLRRGGEVVYQVVVNPINHVLDNLMNWLFADPDKMMTPEAAETGEAVGGLGEAGEELVNGAQEALTGSLIGNIFLAILIGLLLVFIYRVFIRRLHFSAASQTEDDIREQLSVIEPAKKRFRRRKKPSAPEDQVRYYYQRFLDKIDQERELADTTTELDHKAQSLGWNSRPLSQIYRQVRYGNRPADKSLVEKMKQYWRELN